MRVNQTYNTIPTSMTKQEVELVTESVSFVHKWLKEKGIDFKICSDRNPKKINQYQE